MRYDTYVFDLYGTLVDIHTDEEKLEVWQKLALFYGYYHASYEPEELKGAFRRQIAEQEADMRRERQSALGREPDTHEAAPEIALEEVFLKLFRQKGVVADEELAIHAGQFFRILTTERLRLYEGAEELLNALKQAGGRLYLLSNAQRIFTEYELHALGIAPYFEDILISSSYGVKKPDRRFFQVLIDKHHIDASKAVMIGNDMDCDIRGAKQAGLSTFYVHSNLSPEWKGKPDADEMLLYMDMGEIRRRLIG